LDLFGKLLITRHFGRQPEMMSPRLEFMGLQDRADRLSRDALDDPRGFELVSQIRAIPLRERTTHSIWAFTRQLDNIEGHFWRKEGWAA